jgi:PHP family Zn ribbon phosphoesterase
VARKDAGEMEELTCPNCNIDVDPDELKRNNLHCPTCGFDMSESSGDLDDFDEEEDQDEEDEKKGGEEDEKEDKKE